MAKMTLLDMTQNILSAMDSDDVNSITDTVEALQVAEVIAETYDELFGNLEIPEFSALVQLESLTDADRPNYLRIPDNVDKIYEIRYDYKTDDITDYRTLKRLQPVDFLDLVLSRSGQDNVEEVSDESGVKFWIVNDSNPEYWTCFDDDNVVTDAYNSDVDSVLQQSKNLAYCRKGFTFTMEDDFTPHLDANLFPGFLAEAKSVCFANIKQMPNPKEEQRSRRQRVRMQNDLYRSGNRPKTGPDYGRRPR